MTTPSGAATTSAANKAVKAAGATTSAASSAVPTVVDTAEIAVQVPSRVVMKQPLIVGVSILGGAALGVGVLFGLNKLREIKRRKDVEKALNEKTSETVVEKTEPKKNTNKA